MKKRVRRFLEIYFSQYHWCRKLLGGHWELWLTTLPMPAVWINDGFCYIEANKNLQSRHWPLDRYPPGCCRYHIQCEDWN